MMRLVLALLTSLLVSSCTPVDYEVMQESAVARLRQALAQRFSTEFGKGIDAVMGTLAAEGGFLNNPLVKILLPPPLGVALAVGQAVAANPEEALLETLLNTAAEQAIPVAGPVLNEALQSLVLNGKMDTLLSGEPGAVTAALRAEGEDKLKAALLPAIGKSLESTGAGKLYTTLVAARAQVDQVEAVLDKAGEVTAVIDEAGDIASVEEPEDLDALLGTAAPEPAPALAEEEEPAELADLLGEEQTPPAPAPGTAPEDLDDYLTERAVNGIFTLLAEKEDSIRSQLEVPETF